MNEKPKLPPPEIIQKTADNWKKVCDKLDAYNELLDRANDAFEAHILSNPTTAYRLRGIKPKEPKAPQNLEKLPPPEIIQKTADNWKKISDRLDAFNELLDRANEAFEAHILSNPVTAYRLRGIKPKTLENTPEQS